MHPAFYYLKHDVEYDISMIERPRLRPVSEKQETITPENETILLFSFLFQAYSAICNATQMAVCKRMDVSYWENSVPVTDN